MKIIVGDIYSTIMNLRSYPRAMAAVREVCRARPSGYQFMPKYRAGYWDGYISLMESLSSFPTGLLKLVTEELESIGQKVELVVSSDERFHAHDPVAKDFLRGITLRDYQIEAISTLLNARRGIAKMATNSGKTEIMAAIIKALGFCKTIVLLHRKELLYQTAKRFEDRLGISVGKIGDSIWDPKLVTVAMIQTLSSRLGDLDVDGNVLVMVDECHHVSSNTMLDTLIGIPGCYRFGFSGTPVKYDVLSDLKLVAHTGSIVFDLDNKYMMRHEYSAIPIINVCVVENSDEKLWKLEYQQAYTDLIVHNDIRNENVKKFAIADGGTVLVLVERIEHGKLLHESIQGSTFVSGSDSTEYRQEVLNRMNVGGIYIATSIFDEGIDVPAIDCLILAGAGKSHVKILQRIGRGLRKKENGNGLVVYDFIDDNNKFLLEQSSRRMKLYAIEGFKTKLL